MRNSLFNLAFLVSIIFGPINIGHADPLLFGGYGPRAANTDSLRVTKVTNGNPTTKGQYPFLAAVMSGRQASVQIGSQFANAFYFGGGLQSVFSGTVVDCGLALNRCTAVVGKVCSIVLDFPVYDTAAMTPAEQLSNCREGGGIGAIFRPNPAGVDSLSLANTNPLIPAVYLYDNFGYNLIARALLSGSEFSVVVQQSVPETILCGGTYLGGVWVLTAAHCVYDESEGQRRVLNTSELLVDVGAYRLGDAKGNVQTVEKIHLGNYQTNGPWSINDYALLELDSVPLHAKPIQLILRDELDSLAESAASALVLGWGSTAVREPLAPLNPSSSSAAPLSAVLTLHSAAYCRVLWQDFFIRNNFDLSGLDINNSHVCASNVELQQDTCQGDSGGPLLVVSNSELKLAGITSFGLGCGSATSVPGVYTSAPSFLDWVQNKTGISNLSNPDRVLNDQTATDFFSATASAGSGSVHWLTLFILTLLYLLGLESVHPILKNRIRHLVGKKYL